MTLYQYYNTKTGGLDVYDKLVYRDYLILKNISNGK